MKYSSKIVTKKLQFLTELGSTFQTSGRFKKAKKIFQETTEIAKKNGKMEFFHRAYINLAWLYTRERKGELAIKYFEELQEIYNKPGMENQYGIIMGEIGNAYNTLGNFEKAKNYIKKRLEIGLKKQNYTNILSGYNDLSTVYLQQEDYKTALHLLEKALPYRDKFQNPWIWQAIYLNMSICYQKINKTDLALKNFLKSYEFSKQCGSLRTQADLDFFLANIYGEKGEHEKALFYIEEGEKLAKETLNFWAWAQLLALKNDILKLQENHIEAEKVQEELKEMFQTYELPENLKEEIMEIIGEL